MDIIASLSGIAGMCFYKNKENISIKPISINLGMIFCAGITALSFWVLTNDNSWWLANLYLTLPPLFSI